MYNSVRAHLLLRARVLSHATRGAAPSGAWRARRQVQGRPLQSAFRPAESRRVESSCQTQTQLDKDLSARCPSARGIVRWLALARPSSPPCPMTDAAEVSDEGQISRLLARLKNLGLIHNPGQSRLGQPHSWRLTARGAGRAGERRGVTVPRELRSKSSRLVPSL
jgi:hypothetical protein